MDNKDARGGRPWRQRVEGENRRGTVTPPDGSAAAGGGDRDRGGGGLECGEEEGSRGVGVDGL